MSDLIGGIKQIGPTYPVKPVQPSQKDRETGKRKNKRHPSDSDNGPESEGSTVTDDESKRTIDEHI